MCAYIFSQQKLIVSSSLEISGNQMVVSSRVAAFGGSGISCVSSK